MRLEWSETGCCNLAPPHNTMWSAVSCVKSQVTILKCNPGNLVSCLLDFTNSVKHFSYAKKTIPKFQKKLPLSISFYSV